jgi:hypothetical protein
VSADFVDGAHVGGANGRSAKGAFEDTPLAAVPLLLRQAVASRGTVPDGELVDCFCSHHGMTIQRRHHRLFSKLAWSALGRGVLSKDDDGTWSAGPHDGVIDQFGMWTYRQLYARAQELLTDDPEPFERLIVEVTGRDRGQRVVASVIGTAINEAQKSR